MAHFGGAGLCARLKMPIGLRFDDELCWVAELCQGLRGSLAKTMMLGGALTGI